MNRLEYLEIDLSEDNINTLRKLFSGHIAAAWKVSGRTPEAHQNPPAPTKGSQQPAELAKIPEWAAANGHGVAALGWISHQARDAYDAAN